MGKSAEVIKMLAKQLNKKVADMTPEKRIKEDLGVDSLDVVEILMNIEDKFRHFLKEIIFYRTAMSRTLIYSLASGKWLVASGYFRHKSYEFKHFY